MLDDDGMLYLGDLKRVWWLYWLPINNRDIEEVRAAYRPVEVKNACTDLDLDIFEIRTLFPYFLQSIVIRQQPCMN